LVGAMSLQYPSVHLPLTNLPVISHPNPACCRLLANFFCVTGKPVSSPRFVISLIGSDFGCSS
jgi:hypothetical protein